MSPKQEILDEFTRCELLLEDWVGYAPQAFLERAFPNYETLGYQTKHLVPTGLLRRDVFNLVGNPDVSDFECMVSILAWGQIRYNNMRYLVPMFSEICAVIKKLRAEPVDRRTAYRMFSNLRARGLKGMGPAYFTKIIYFCTKNSNERGYILDQWTARSSNLIFGTQIALLDKFPTFQRVSDANTENNYEKFCRGVELIADKLNSLNAGELSHISSDEVERKMFSIGGKNKGKWRQFVLSHT